MLRSLRGKEILITGGTGSLGKTLVKLLIKDGHHPHGIRVFSRDEQKQWAMAEEIRQFQQALGTSVPVGYLIGDVRERARLMHACLNVDVIIHTAAMKHVPACEDNPLEAIRTNIHGAENVLEAALARNVEAVMHVSTDKAVHPINLYGATKQVAEKLFIQGNVYAGRNRTRFSACRYGNVLGSNGSVLVRWRQMLEQGKPLPFTHGDMTRFWITLPRVGRFLLARICDMEGGEVFVPSMGSMTMAQMLTYFRGDRFFATDLIGVRPGEKFHEVLVAPEEAGTIIPEADGSWYFIIGRGVPGDGLYSNGKNHPNWTISGGEFRAMLEDKI